MSEIRYARYHGKWNKFAEPKLAKMLDEGQDINVWLNVYVLAWRIAYVQQMNTNNQRIEGIQYLDHFGQIITPSEIDWRELP